MNRKITRLSASLLLVLLTTSLLFVDEGFNSKTETTSEIKIGNQIWMTQNLNVDKFRNGDPIPHARTKRQWRKAAKAGEPAWCYYGSDSYLGGKNGRLYNWHAVNDPRGLAPDGWRIPNLEEWEQLVTELGGKSSAGLAMKSSEDWRPNGNGTNSSGFNGRPAGFRNADGIYYFLGEYAKWWTATEGDTKNAWSHFLCHGSKLAVKYYMHKGYGLSVRCVKE